MTKLINTTLHEIVEREQEYNMFKEKLTELLDTPMSTEMKERFRDQGVTLTGDKINDAIHGAVIIQALNGNLQAWTAIRDTLGYKPIDQVQSDVTVRIEMPQKARELGE